MADKDFTSDRELLELAAKASGINLYKEDVFANGLTQQVSPNGVLRWNPLTDDGDALRLAVKLNLLVDCMKTKADVIGHNGECVRVIVGHEADRDAATRRAIVRVAASIGAAL